MLDDAFKEIILYKAERMKTGLIPGSPYNTYIREVLGQPGIHVCEEQVENFVMGGVDAMIYDVASLVGFNANTLNHADWASYTKRREMLNEIFPPQDRQRKQLPE